MAYRLLAGTCLDGPCPNFYVDDETGDVLVQGYLTTDRPPAPAEVPDTEGLLRIDAVSWLKLLAQLVK